MRRSGVPTDEDMLALVKVVPDRCQAAIWCGAGEGLRLGEVLGLENSERCIDRSRQELHVVQQLRFHKGQYGGFYLARPKSGSVGDVDLDDHVALALGEHVRKYPPALVELPDITGGPPIRGSGRSAGRSRCCSPTTRASRFNPTDVQNALRHSSLRITLETYVHWWPKKNRRRNIVSTALREAAGNCPGLRLPG